MSLKIIVKVYHVFPDIPEGETSNVVSEIYSFLIHSLVIIPTLDLDGYSSTNKQAYVEEGNNYVYLHYETQ